MFMAANLFSGLNSLCLASQASSFCLQVPSVGPQFYWPVGVHSTDGYCYCIPHRLLATNFARCVSDCASMYPFTYMSTGHVCLQLNNGILQQDSILKAYFIIETSSQTTPRYFTYSFFSSYWISQKC